MKKRLAVLAIILVMSLALTGCEKKEETKTKTLSIVTTIFPEYDWVMQVLGDQAGQADVTMLLDTGVDLHSFQPTANDIIKLSRCDLFIYVGGESDGWVDDALKESVNKNMVVLNLLDVLGDAAKEEEIIEGMEAEEDEEEEEEGVEYDEHVWLSLRNAGIFVNTIRDALIKLDAANADAYTANAAAYQEKLDALDQEYARVTEAAPCKTLLFGDRFPFRYLVDDYGLNYYAAFVGCSAESEASFETIVFLVNRVNELDLHHVMTLEGSNQRIAETIIATSEKKDAHILSMNSMQSTTQKDVAAGTSYLSIMEKNLAVLKEALQ